jgi:hypothetical protein
VSNYREHKGTGITGRKTPLIDSEDIVKPFIEVNGSGSVDLSEVAANITTLNLDNVLEVEGGVFSSDSGGILFTGNDGTKAKISYSVSGVNNETGTRSTSVHALNVNGRQARSQRYGYHRTNGDGFDNIKYSGIYTLNNGDLITVESNVRVNGEDVDMLLEESNLIIEVK